MNTQPPDDALVEQAAKSLGEHFDAVLILASRYEPATENGTVTCQCGAGNLHTLVGMASEYVSRQDEFVRCHARRKDKEE